MTVPSGRADTDPTTRTTHSWRKPVRDLEPGQRRVDDDLQQARDVADVEEDLAAVVAPTPDPTTDGDRLADVVGAHIAGPMRSHHDRASSFRVRSHAAISSRRTSD